MGRSAKSILDAQAVCRGLAARNTRDQPANCIKIGVSQPACSGVLHHDVARVPICGDRNFVDAGWPEINTGDRARQCFVTGAIKDYHVGSVLSDPCMQMRYPPRRNMARVGSSVTQIS